VAVIHHVFANRSNAGDWLSAIGIQRLLGERDSEVVIVEHLCDGPFVEETLGHLAQADADDVILIGGGGLLMDYFDDLWTGIEALGADRRLVLWGLGACDMKTEATLPAPAAVRAVAARAQICVVRDELSRALLGTPQPAVPCPSVAAVDRVPSLERGVLHVAALDTTGPDAYAGARGVCAAYARRTDRPFREINNRFEPGDEAGLRGTLEQYRRADVIVSARLHGCILALATGRPVVAVSGDHKIEAFMRSAGLGDWVLDVDDCAALPELLAEAHAQPAVTAFVDRIVSENRTVAAAVADLCSVTA
jgi:polysaccharide pyruvyl transferase WcaK-like protein